MNKERPVQRALRIMNNARKEQDQSLDAIKFTLDVIAETCEETLNIDVPAQAHIDALERIRRIIRGE